MGGSVCSVRRTGDGWKPPLILRQAQEKTRLKVPPEITWFVYIVLRTSVKPCPRVLEHATQDINCYGAQGFYREVLFW
jgi:hypothetical protein